MELEGWLADVLSEDFDKINYSLIIMMDVVCILRAIGKYFGGATTYSKGKVSMFMEWMRRYNPTVYLCFVMCLCVAEAAMIIDVDRAVVVLIDFHLFCNV